MCDCISVTYQLIGEDPVTVEVESNGSTNGKVSWTSFLIEGNNYNVFWVTGAWRFNGGSPSIQQARLITDNNCPFGEYTILESSAFSAFKVGPCY